MQMPESHCTDRFARQEVMAVLAQDDTWLRVPAGVPSPAFLAPPTEGRISQLALGVTRAHNQYAAPPQLI